VGAKAESKTASSAPVEPEFALTAPQCICSVSCRTAFALWTLTGINNPDAYRPADPIRPADCAGYESEASQAVLLTACRNSSTNPLLTVSLGGSIGCRLEQSGGGGAL